MLARANGTTAYRAAIRVATSGAVFVQLKKAVNGVESNVGSEVAVSGLNAAAAAQIAFRFDVVGSQLQFRVWAASGTDPGTWQVSATDTTAGLGVAGSEGIRFFTGAPVPNGPVIDSLSSFQVRQG